jgi:hypothetical protein
MVGWVVGVVSVVGVVALAVEAVSAAGLDVGLARWVDCQVDVAEGRREERKRREAEKEQATDKSVETREIGSLPL